MSVTDSLVRGSITAVTAVVFALSRRFLPADSVVSISEKDEAKFRKLNWVVAPAVLLTGAAFFSICYFLFLAMNRMIAATDGKAAFVLLPTHAMWTIAPCFAAICLSWELMLGIWMLFGNTSEARRFEAWTNQKAGFSATRALRLMAIWIALPTGIATILALPIRTSVQDNAFIVCHYEHWKPRIYSYPGIRQITVTQGLRGRDGGFTPRAAIVLDFSNGDRWSSADNRDFETSIDGNLLAFLESKTKLSARYIEAFPFGQA